MNGLWKYIVKWAIDNLSQIAWLQRKLGAWWWLMVVTNSVDNDDGDDDDDGDADVDYREHLPTKEESDETKSSNFGRL